MIIVNLTTFFILSCLRILQTSFFSPDYDRLRHLSLSPATPFPITKLALHKPVIEPWLSDLHFSNAVVHFPPSRVPLHPTKLAFYKIIIIPAIEPCLSDLHFSAGVVHFPPSRVPLHPAHLQVARSFRDVRGRVCRSQAPMRNCHGNPRFLSCRHPWK